MMPRSVFLCGASIAALACASEPRDGTQGQSPVAEGVGAGATADAGVGAIDRGSASDASSVATPAPPPPVPMAVVYGHSGTELYRLDPSTKAVTVVGAFVGCAADVIDIALDENSRLFATAYDGVYAIDPKNAHCTLIAQGTYPNSLSFVPKGTVDAKVEALVGYVGSTYVRIDPTSGAVSEIGDLDQDGYVSSGDVVSTKGGGSYLTVSGPGCDDCIVEINPSSGKFIRRLGGLAHTHVFGLAYWGGAAYGFDQAGEIFEIDLVTPGAPTKLIPIPGAPPTLSFWGAGSTTSAPVVLPTPPPPDASTPPH